MGIFSDVVSARFSHGLKVAALAVATTMLAPVSIAQAQTSAPALAPAVVDSGYVSQEVKAQTHSIYHTPSQPSSISVAVAEPAQ